MNEKKAAILMQEVIYMAESEDYTASDIYDEILISLNKAYKHGRLDAKIVDVMIDDETFSKSPQAVFLAESLNEVKNS